MKKIQLEKIPLYNKYKTILLKEIKQVEALGQKQSSIKNIQWLDILK